MKGISSLREREGFGHRQMLRCVFFAGLLACVLSISLGSSGVSTPRVFAALLQPAQNVFTVSPTQGPVDAVIAVSATGVTLPDGTQVSLGYTTNLQTCTVVNGGQVPVVQGGAFNGWFRWPTSTGVGTFGVCAVANNAPFQIGSYQVLSASAPHIATTPTPLKASQQATVAGTNFLPAGTSVNLVWKPAKGGRSISLGTVSSDSTGAFSHTFTVPARAATGSYTVTASAGSDTPPTLSATTTFHVDGVTIVAVPTPTAGTTATATATSAPTATATSVTTTPHVVPTPLPASAATSNLNNKAGLLVPIALGSGLLILLALVAGIVIARRQRQLVANAPAGSGNLLWPEAADTQMMGGANAGAGAFSPPMVNRYQGGGPPPVSAGFQPTMPPAMPVGERKQTPIPALPPFDPGLAEAMREAQVSLFATPRPPISEEIEVR